MKTRWTRLISVLCLVALLIGMLPVVAVAATEEVTYTADFKEVEVNADPANMGEENYFTCLYGPKDNDHVQDLSASNDFADGYVIGNAFRMHGGTKKSSNNAQEVYTGGRSIKFTTTTANAVVKVWAANGGSNARTVAIWDASGNSTGGDPVSVAAKASSKNGVAIGTFTLPAAGTYYVVAPDNGLYICKVTVTETKTVEDKPEEPTPVSGKVELDKDTVDLTAGTSETVVATAAKQVYAVAADADVTTTVKANEGGTYTVTLDTEVKEAKTVEVYVVTGDTEIKTLEAAKAAYDDKNGAVLTVNIQTVLDKDALTEAVAAAEKLADGVVTDDNDGENTSTHQQWVTSAAKTALDKALDAAKKALDEATTQKELDDALEALKKAMEGFKPADGKNENAAVKATKVVLNKTEVELKVDETYKLTADVEPKEATDTIYWATKDTDVISLSADKGKEVTVTAKAKGEATITVTAGDATATVTVTVTEETVVEPTTDTVEAGVYYFSAKNKDNDPYWTAGTAERVWTETDGKAPEVKGVTFGGNWNYSNDHGPNGAAGATITFNVAKDDVATTKLVIVTCGYGNGEELAVTGGTVTVEKITDEKGAETGRVYTITPTAETVTATFGSAVYVHGIAVEQEGKEPAGDATYAITVDTDATKGTVTVAETAKAGETVTVTVAPAEGYEVDAVTVKTASGKDVTVAEADGKYTFEMPGEAVTVTVTFKATTVEPTDDTYAIAVDADATKGTVTVAETAKAGETVTVTVAPAEGYEVDAVTVKTASGKDVTVAEADGKYTFEMPGEAVTVTVTFKATTTPETVDKTALEKAVKDAQAKVAGVKTSVDGKDIAQGEKWATEAELKDINDAIAAAQAVLDNKDATQAQVNSALETLNAAIAAFTPKEGSKTEEQPGEVDKTALDEAIKKATGLYNATQVSKAGDGSDINPAQKWVTDEQYTDFLTDILAAQLIQADPDATQAEVHAAVEALNAASAAFEAARKDGLNKDAPILAEDIVVDPESLELKVGGSAKLTATVSPDNVTDKTVYWNTEDTSLISLSAATTQSGETITVTAKAVGTATIFVMVGQKYTEVTVTITKADTPTPGGGGIAGGRGSSAGTSTSTTKTNPFGGKVTIVTTTAGGKTLTVTDKNGEVVAKVVIPAQTPDLGYKFTDVPDGHWAEPSIQAMAAMKIFQGVSTTGHIFDMNSAVTRGTMAQILFNLSQGKAGINNPFTDAQGSWYSDAVAWAAMVGVVTGVSDTNFAPDQAITREQLITMLYRFAQLLALDTNVTADMGKFVDANEISSWASEAMTWAVGKGLIIGKGAGDLDPTASASRAEAAVIIDRFLQMV